MPINSKNRLYLILCPTLLPTRWLGSKQCAGKFTSKGLNDGNEVPYWHDARAFDADCSRSTTRHRLRKTETQAPEEEDHESETPDTSPFGHAEAEDFFDATEKEARSPRKG